MPCSQCVTTEERSVRLSSGIKEPVVFSPDTKSYTCSYCTIINISGKKSKDKPQKITENNQAVGRRKKLKK